MAKPLDHAKLEQLESVLRKQLDVASSLLDVLNEEYDAIRRRDAQSLIDLAPQKLDGLNSLESLESQKRLITDADALPEDAQSQWYRVIDMVRLCQRKNQRNGVMLEMRLQSTNAALDLIAGHDSAQMIYSPDGKASPAPRSSGSAILA